MQPKFTFLAHVATTARQGLMRGFEIDLSTQRETPETSSTWQHPYDRTTYEASLAELYDLACTTLLESRGYILVVAGSQSPPRSQQFTSGDYTLILHDLRERSIMDYVAGVTQYMSAMEQVNFEASDHHLLILEGVLSAHCAATYAASLSKSGKRALARLNGNFEAAISQGQMAALMTLSPLNEDFGGDFPGGALTTANDTFVAFHEIGHRAHPPRLNDDTLEQAKSFILSILDWIELPPILSNIPSRVRATSFDSRESLEASIDSAALGALEDLLYPSDEAWNQAVASLSATCCLSFSTRLAHLISNTGGHITSDDLEDAVALSALRLGSGLRKIWNLSSLCGSEIPPEGPTIPGSLVHGDAVRVWASVAEPLCTVIEEATSGKLYPWVAIPGSTGEPWWWNDDDRQYYFSDYSQESPEFVSVRGEKMLQRVWEAQGRSRIGPNLVSMRSSDLPPIVDLMPWETEFNA